MDKIPTPIWWDTEPTVTLTKAELKKLVRKKVKQALKEERMFKAPSEEILEMAGECFGAFEEATGCILARATRTIDGLRFTLTAEAIQVEG